MTGAALSTVVGGIVALAAIASATVALAIGHLDGATYAAIVAGFGGAGVGVGAHAASSNGTSSKP